LRLLVALMLLALVCTRSRLLVLLRRLVNSVKLRRFTLDVDWRFSVALRCRVVGAVVAAAVVRLSVSSCVLPEGRGDMPKLLGEKVVVVVVMPTRWG
jgi:hypothetical protein